MVAVYLGTNSLSVHRHDIVLRSYYKSGTKLATEDELQERKGEKAGDAEEAGAVP
jgi:hypothetical protein